MFVGIQVVFIIIFPALILYLEQRIRFVQVLSPIVICYAFGILVANLPFINLNSTVFSEVSEISISLAIPLLLFNSNVLDWIKHAGKSILSYMLSVIAVVISAIMFYYIYKNNVQEAWKVSGMLIGVYTGGTPNMSAIGMAFETPQEVFILLNSSDVVLGSIYFIFIITFIKKLLGLFLPDYKFAVGKESKEVARTQKKISPKQLTINVIIVLLLGVIILGLAVWISITIKGKIAMPWVILVLTTLGIGVSFIKKIQKLKGSYETAFYLLLIFSLSIGALADVNELLNKSSNLFLYTAFVMFTAIILHFLMAAFFRIDRDTVIITSTAAIYGPAFIGPVANAIKNREVIVPGITMGLLGYAIGNYIGIGIAMLLS
jgi:uncharacterized membrane protein